MSLRSSNLNEIENILIDKKDLDKREVNKMVKIIKAVQFFNENDKDIIKNYGTQW